MTKHDNPDYKPMGMPIFDRPDARTFAKFAPRWLGLAAVVAAVGLPGESLAIKAYDSLTASQPSVAGRLAEPFAADKQAVEAGQFAPGAVVETPLAYTDLNRDAANYSNSDYYGSQASTDAIHKDMVAEVGSDPHAQEVYLPAADVNMHNLPDGSHVIK